MGLFPANASEAAVTQSNVYWGSQAKPFLVTEAAYSNTSVCADSGKTRGLVLVLKNTEKYNLTLTAARVAGNNTTVCLLNGNVGTIEFGSGKESLIGVDLDDASPVCVGSPRYAQFELGFTYDSPYIQNKLQLGSTPRFVSCEPVENSGSFDGTACDRAFQSICIEMGCDVATLCPEFSSSQTAENSALCVSALHSFVGDPTWDNNGYAAAVQSC
jgi:hypothetical protein